MQKDANIPIIINNTKDYFAFDMHVTEQEIESNGKKYLKKVYYFNPHNLPENYVTFQPKHLRAKVKTSQFEKNNPLNYPTGCHCFENFFSNAEMMKLENKIVDVE